MKTLLPILLLINSLFIYSNEVKITDIGKRNFSASEGTHFLLGFMEHEIDNSTLELNLFVSSRFDTKITINVPGELEPFEFELVKDVTRQFSLHPDVEVRASEVNQKKAVEIFSDFPISVVGYSGQVNTSDTYAALPVEKLGKNYVIASFDNDQYLIPTGEDDPEELAWRRAVRPSEFMLIGTEDETTVRFTPRARTMAFREQDREHIITLQKGDCFLVKSSNTPRGTGDLTGTVISSDKAIAVLTGHSRVSLNHNNYNFRFDSKDHLLEMLMPIEMWGTTYVSLPFQSNLPDGILGPENMYRIIASEPNTIVSLKTARIDRSYHLAEKGDFLTIYTDDVAHWVGTKPFQLAQYMYRQGRQIESNNFDPALVIVPPIDKGIDNSCFLIPDINKRYWNGTAWTGYRFSHHALNIVADANALPSLRLNGRLISELVNIGANRIANTGLHYANLTIAPGNYILECETGKFNTIAYGLGYVDSYAHWLGVGASIESIKSQELAFNSEVECTIVKVEVIELNDEIPQISKIDLNKDLNVNFDFVYEIVDKKLHITAQPIDIEQNGFLALDIFQNDGSGRRITYQYVPENLEFTNEIVFNDLELGTEYCLEYTIKNNSALPTNFDFRKLNFDSKFTINPNVNQIELEPNEEFEFRVCIDLKETDFGPFYDSIKVTTLCKEEYISIAAFVDFPNLIVQGHDFGAIRTMNEAEGEIKIINNGNQEINIINLTYDAKYFTIEPSEFNYILPVGDTIVCSATFSPLIRGQFISQVMVNDQFNLKRQTQLLGVAKEPEIQSQLIDLGKLRVGAPKSSSITLQNIGDWEGNLVLDNFPNNSDILTPASLLKMEDFLQMYAAKEANSVIIDLKNEELNSFSERYSFYLDPQYEKAIVVNNNITAFEVQKVNIDLIFESTIPTIETFKTDLGSQYVFESKSFDVKAFIAGGNEQLTVDRVFIIDGDDDSFEIKNSSIYDKGVYQPGEEAYVEELVFTPQRVGYHYLLLGVINDAEPNYRRRIDTVLIHGIALQLDTCNLEINFTSAPINACGSGIGQFVVENTGNTELTIENIEINSTNADIVKINFDDLPIILQFGENYSFQFEIHSTNRDNIDLDLILTANNRQINFDTLVSISHQVPVNSLGMDLESNVTGKFFPGENVNYFIAGSFPEFDNYMQVSAKVEVDYSFKTMLLQQSEIEIFFENYIVDKINLPITKNNGKLTFEFPIFENCNNLKWYANFEFLVLLDISRKITTNASFAYDQCFVSASAETEHEIDPVCYDKGRYVESLPAITLFEIKPNPVATTLNIEYLAQIDDVLDLELIDLLGNKVSICRKYNLQKGKHYINFGTDIMSNGVYNAVFTTSTGYSQSILLVINK